MNLRTTRLCWYRPGSHVPFPVLLRLRLCLCFRRTSETAFILVIPVFSTLAFWHSGFPGLSTGRCKDTVHVLRTRTGDLFVNGPCMQLLVEGKERGDPLTFSSLSRMSFEISISRFMVSGSVTMLSIIFRSSEMSKGQPD